MTAPVQQGLHGFLEHQVLWQGGKFDVPFALTVGSVAVNSSAVTQTVAADAARSTSPSRRASTCRTALSPAATA